MASTQEDYSIPRPLSGLNIEIPNISTQRILEPYETEVHVRRLIWANAFISSAHGLMGRVTINGFSPSIYLMTP